MSTEEYLDRIRGFIPNLDDTEIRVVDADLQAIIEYCTERIYPTPPPVPAKERTE